MMNRNDLQELLVRKSIVTQQQLATAVKASQGSNKSWLEQLLLQKVVDEHVLCELLSRSAGVPQVDLRELAAVQRSALALIPADLAIEHRVVPIAIERDGDLRIAMLDPTNAAAFAEVQFFAGVRVLREVATASGIACALHHYYNARTALWPRVEKRPSMRVTAPTLRVVSESRASW